MRNDHNCAAHIPALDNPRGRVAHPLHRARYVRVHGQRQPTTALLIASPAELARLTVLHVDKDFDLSAAITGQRIERLGV
jgi:predicted nucleic acid-binding protein